METAAPDGTTSTTKALKWAGFGLISTGRAGHSGTAPALPPARKGCAFTWGVAAPTPRSESHGMREHSGASVDATHTTLSVLCIATRGGQFQGAQPVRYVDAVGRDHQLDHLAVRDPASTPRWAAGAASLSRQ